MHGHGLTIIIIVTAALGASAGCRSDATFAIERRHPAPVSLPDVTTLAVTAFVGSGGDPMASALSRALARDDAYTVSSDRLDARTAEAAARSEDDAALAKLAKAAGIDGVVTGRVQTLDVSRTLEANTLVTKRVNSEPKDVPTVRKLKTGHLSVVFRVVLADGRVVRGHAVDKDFRAERIEDPMPHLTTLEPKEYPHDPIPTDAELVEQLVADAASDMVRDMTPRREPVTVTWEEAGGVDDEARELFARHEFTKAGEKLRSILHEPANAAGAERPEAGSQLSLEQRAACLYDLGLCEDAAGDLARADRHLDEALTLQSTERHLTTLRDVRRREELARGEGRR